MGLLMEGVKVAGTAEGGVEEGVEEGVDLGVCHLGRRRVGRWCTFVGCFISQESSLGVLGECVVRQRMPRGCCGSI